MVLGFHNTFSNLRRKLRSSARLALIVQISSLAYLYECTNEMAQSTSNQTDLIHADAPAQAGYEALGKFGPSAGPKSMVFKDHGF